VPESIANIQEINLVGAPGLVPLFLPIPTVLDLVNQTDGSLETLGFHNLGVPGFGLGGGLVKPAGVLNVQSDVSTINVHDSNASLMVQFINEALSGEDDELTINLRNSEVGLMLEHDGTA